ncbi:RNA metabolism protein [Lithospermum erythrorhizon]|uniref:RNA metabolism protein n=1 Tax=Lithospermum erythrorhizon TaxID=34254 RepID=A0AAV3QZ84_LITER
MAMQSTEQPASPGAQVVGNAFVEQYYHILHQSPELVYRFYQDTSMLSRPDPNGVITSVTTTKDINEKICSLDYKNYKAEIKTADAQLSFNDGVIVLVTGCLTGKDNLRRKFAQTFFLAPQENGYFVLNDVFRFVEENEPDTTLGKVNQVDNSHSSSLVQETEPANVISPTNEEAASLSEMVQKGGEKTPEPVLNDEQVGNGREIIVDGESQMHENDNISVAEPATPDDGHKKSYASIVSSQTKKVSTKVYVPTNSPGSAARKTAKHAVVTVAQAAAPEALAPSVPINATAPVDNDIQDEGTHIFIDIGMFFLPRYSLA